MSIDQPSDPSLRSDGGVPREDLLRRFHEWQESDHGGYCHLIELAHEMAEALAGSSSLLGRTQGEEQTEDKDQGLLRSYGPSLSAGPEASSMGWRPIETAPKDGTEVLLLTPEGVDIGEWKGACGASIDDPGHDAGWFGMRYAFPGCTGVRTESTYYTEAMAQPTAWMPLPPADAEAQPVDAPQGPLERANRADHEPDRSSDLSSSSALLGPELRAVLEELHTLSQRWGQEAHEIDQDGDFCCAHTRRNDAGELHDLLRKHGLDTLLLSLRQGPQTVEKKEP